MAPAAVLPSPSDFRIEVIVTEQKCFGSAGCIYTYTLDPSYVGTRKEPCRCTLGGMPAIRRFQQSGECVTCGGQARFYPAPVDEDQALAETPDDVETTGTWTHLNPADWIGNPHPVEVAAAVSVE